MRRIGPGQPEHASRDRVVAGYSIASEAEHYLSASSGGFTAPESTLVDRHVHPGSRVLVIGSGGGRELVALRARGAAAVGIELVPRLVRGYRARIPDALRPSAILGDMSRLPFRIASFDAVLFFNQVLEHGPSRADRQRALREALRVAPHGVTIASLYVGAVDDWSALLYLWGRSRRRGSVSKSAEHGTSRTWATGRRAARLRSWARGKTFRLWRTLGFIGPEVYVRPSGSEPRGDDAFVPVHLYRFREFSEDVREAGGIILTWDSAVGLGLRTQVPALLGRLDHLQYIVIGVDRGPAQRNGERITGLSSQGVANFPRRTRGSISIRTRKRRARE